MKIYLDNCCFNRPFDDQTQLRIRLESEAKLSIQYEIHEGKLELVWSYIMDIENEANPFEERKRAIRDWKKHAIMDVIEHQDIIDGARYLRRIGLRSKDALHISCAIFAECDYFLTTDDDIRKKQGLIDKIAVKDSIGFIREIYL